MRNTHDDESDSFDGPSLSLSLYIATNQSCSANDLVASLRHATLHLSTLE